MNTVEKLLNVGMVVVCLIAAFVWGALLGSGIGGLVFAKIFAAIILLPYIIMSFVEFAPKN